VKNATYGADIMIKMTHHKAGYRQWQFHINPSLTTAEKRY